MNDIISSLDQAELQPLKDFGPKQMKSNLACLKKRFPTAAARAEEANVTDWVYQTTPAGGFSAGPSTQPQRVNDQSENESLVDVRSQFMAKLQEHKAQIFVLTGFGSGRVAHQMMQDLNDFNAPVLILEPDAAAFQATLRFSDLEELLDYRKFFFAVGEDFQKQAIQILDRFNLCVIPEFCILIREKAIPTAQRQMYLHWVEQINREKQSLADRLNEKVVAFLNQSRKFSIDSIRKVWLYERSPDAEEHTRVNRFIASQMIQAIEKENHKVDAPQYHAQTYYPPFAAVQNLIESDPDMILLLNTISTDLAVFGENFSTRLHRPKLSWFVDSPYLMRDIIEVRGLSDCDILASTDERWFEDVKTAHPEMANRKVHVLPLAATYEEEGPVDPAWECPVSYVGQVRDLKSVWDGLKISHSIREVLEKLVESLRLHRGERPESMIQTAPELAELRQQYDLSSFLRTYYGLLIWEANSRHRAETLIPLAEYGIRIFGNDGWNCRIADTALDHSYTGKTVGT